MTRDVGPLQRFGDRVDDYVRSRPGYPPGVVDVLRDVAGFGAGTRVADIGSGTGLLARVLLDAGAHVVGVEPNAEMRAAGDAWLAGDARFSSVAGSAEATTLADASVDLVTAAQAFHWFDPPRARTEFARILVPDGAVALVWNDRRTDTTAFLVDYEALLAETCPEYLKVRHRNVTDAVIDAFFAPQPVHRVVLDSAQVFDRAGLLARHRSMSYVPKSGPDAARIEARLEALFDRHAGADGTVAFEYDTRVHVGRLRA
ncbi:MAG: class I SAM-dependent methyltransferase [Burkholderiales bacterium]|jgi:SAM-dependent methyltransferase|nr:class I SAM-dependent methyltransferase [Burkholderiales bacterium]